VVIPPLPAPAAALIPPVANCVPPTLLAPPEFTAPPVPELVAPPDDAGGVELSLPLQPNNNDA